VFSSDVISVAGSRGDDEIDGVVVSTHIIIIIKYKSCEHPTIRSLSFWLSHYRDIIIKVGCKEGLDLRSK
jgi:hypothetical protein